MAASWRPARRLRLSVQHWRRMGSGVVWVSSFAGSLATNRSRVRCNSFLARPRGSGASPISNAREQDAGVQHGPGRPCAGPRRPQARQVRCTTSDPSSTCCRWGSLLAPAAAACYLLRVRSIAHARCRLARSTLAPRPARRTAAPVTALDPSAVDALYQVQEFGLTIMGVGIVSTFAAGMAHTLRRATATYTATAATTIAAEAPAAVPAAAAAPVEQLAAAAEEQPAPVAAAAAAAPAAPAAPVLELADIKSELQQAAAAAVAAVKSAAAAEPAPPAKPAAAAAPAPAASGAAVKPGLTVEEATQVGGTGHADSPCWQLGLAPPDLAAHRVSTCVPTARALNPMPWLHPLTHPHCFHATTSNPAASQGLDFGVAERRRGQAGGVAGVPGARCSTHHPRDGALPAPLRC